MNAIWTLAKKDLLVLWRDRVSLFWMFGLPLIFAAFFGSVFGGSGPGKSNPLRVAVISEGLTDGGRRLVERLDASDAIEIHYKTRPAAEDAVRRGNMLAYLDVKSAPEEDLGMFAGQMASIEIGIDPSRQAEKALLQGLLNEAMFAGLRDLMTDPGKTRAQLGRMADRVKADDSMSVIQKLAMTTFFGSLDKFLDTPGVGGEGGNAMEPQVTVVSVTRQRTGPPNAYSISFPQSILWGILGCAAGFAISLVRERTTGTMVRLLTAPISHAHLLAGKTLACAISCCAVALVMTTVGALFFGVTVDSIALLVLATIVSAVCFAGLTMLLGSLAKTEQAVSGLGWGVLLVFAMLGGGMVPQIVMPSWMLDIGAISPARWTISAFEGAIWRGFSIGEMVLPCSILLVFGAVAMALGAMRLRRAD